mgnify:CR=1 FL=1
MYCESCQTIYIFIKLRKHGSITLTSHIQKLINIQQSNLNTIKKLQKTLSEEITQLRFQKHLDEGIQKIKHLQSELCKQHNLKELLTVTRQE